MEIKHWDVIIVGGGMAGLLTAYFLLEKGKKVLILEAEEVGSGQTGRTTAKITSQHGLKYDKLIQTVGRKKALLYARANQEAIRAYERLLEKEQIACQFERLPAYLYATTQTRLPGQEDAAAVLQKEAEAAKSLGIDACFVEGSEMRAELPFPVAGAVCFRDQAQFSALEFISQLAPKLEIQEHTRVRAVRGNRVYTDTEVLVADSIVLSTHYPLKNVPGFYFLRQHQERSYVLALARKEMSVETEAGGQAGKPEGRPESILEGGQPCRPESIPERGQLCRPKSIPERGQPCRPESIPERGQPCRPESIPESGQTCRRSDEPLIDGIYYGIGTDSYSIRRMGELLLLGSSAHRTGQPGPGGAYAPLMQAARQYFPQYRVEAAWSAQDCMPHDGIPFIGKFSLFTPHIYVATGFQKWGMTTSMLAAMLLCDEICGTPNPYAKIFSPQRLNFRAAIGKFLVDVGMSVKGLSQGLFSKRERRCSHMGCRLKWNPDERSWDCPCHGSRFDAEGKLLDNPAKRDI